MYRQEHCDLLSLEDLLLPFGGKLSGDNRWIKLAELIPWDELENDYAAQFPGLCSTGKTLAHGTWCLDHQGPSRAHR